jgi:hypothetical protein
MAFGDTLAANVAETTTEIVTATIVQMPQLAPMLGLVTRKNIPKGFDRVEIPRVNTTFSVQTPTEGDELVNSSQFDLTSTTIQPTRRAIMVRVDDRATYFSKDDVIALVSSELARAQAQDIDTDLTAEFVNFGQSAGTTGGEATLSYFRTARRKLRANTVANGGPAPAPFYAVISPIAEEDMFTNLGVQGVVSSTSPWIPTGWSQEMIASYHIPQNQLLGVGMFVDGYMSENGSADFICGMFSKQALWFAISKDWDMKTFEVPNWIGPIIRCVADYNSGVGAYSNWGVAITVDGA